MTSPQLKINGVLGKAKHETLKACQGGGYNVLRLVLDKTSEAVQGEAAAGFFRKLTMTGARIYI